MIGTSRAEHIWVVFWATVLHSIGPLSLLHCAVNIFYADFYRIFLYITAIEAVFYVCTIIYVEFYLQRPANHPPLTSKEERLELFDRCLESTADPATYLSKWFCNEPISSIKRENLREFLLWAFLNTNVDSTDYDEELGMYMTKMEDRLGFKFPEGRSDARCIRLTLDKVNPLHRSLTWYMCILVVDLITHTYLRYFRFQFFRASTSHSLRMLPPRPHAFLASQPSSAPTLSYWLKPHTSTNELPVVFLHGIGVGLWPYMQFLREFNEGRLEEDGEIGILVVEILPISSRLTSSMPSKAEMCQQLKIILDQHHFDNFVLVSHSYGSVIATHLLKTPELATRIASIIFVDPISILLNQPDVAYNFTIRRPRFANEWLLWYFGSKDIGVAHTLSRTFFWSENVLWKEDLVAHRCVVFLSEQDSIINSLKVRSYLQEDAYLAGNEKERVIRQAQLSQTEGLLKVVWCENLDHGQVFDLASWRGVLKQEMLIECSRTEQ